jgi:hypothetical protein
LRDSAEPEKIERLLRVLEQRKGHELLADVETAGHCFANLRHVSQTSAIHQ